MKHITQILKDNGYKEYRLFIDIKETTIENELGEVINQKVVTKKYKPNTTNSFSSMVSGGLDICYIKNNDVKNIVVYGLETQGNPPTLITPKLKYVDERGNISFFKNNYILSKIDNQIVFDNLFKNVSYLEKDNEIKCV